MQNTSQRYIKGFKIDAQKIEKNLGHYPTAEDPQNARHYGRIIGLIPRTSYMYIDVGLEEDDEVCLVIVMADGWDKEELEKMEMPFYDGVLAQAANRVLTPGVWFSDD